MKFTLSWLRDHLETTKTLAELADGLTQLGLEVEGIENKTATFAPFKVAYVRDAKQHPNADRLRVLNVETADHGVLQVVCGAPNARAEMKGIFAPDGSFVPGTGVTLKKGVIRGEESNGMMVSEKEMGLSDDHDGIIEVDDKWPVGTPFVDVFGLNDPVIEIKLTPNRADCAGVRGIARDLAAAGYGTLKPLDQSGPSGLTRGPQDGTRSSGQARGSNTFQSPIAVDLTFPSDAENACPLFFGRYIKGVKNGPSPEWLQAKLKSIGLRPISALVDITNLMTIDLNRPLHVFDADKVTGNIHVRLAHNGETLAALNDKTYTLTDTMTAVCDDSGVLGLGGIIGGVSTGCNDDTVNVFVEAAYFDPLRTARTGRALGVESDARYRFERGIDPAFTREGLEIATRLIQELCGGEASGIVTAGTGPDWQRTIDFRPARVSTLGGVDVPAKTQEKILHDLGFGVAAIDDVWTVTPPSWRGDIDGEADVVEEITRVYGFDKIPPVSVVADDIATAPAETVRGASSRLARVALATRGLNECVTYSFMSSKHAELFGANDHGAAAQLKIANPINADWDQMRPSALPNLILAAGRNADRGFGNAALFEVGPAFQTQKINGQRTVAAGIRHGKMGDKHWAATNNDRAVDVFDAKADVFAVLSATLGLDESRAVITRDAPSWYHPGRSGAVKQGNVVLAYFGELHPHVMDELRVDGVAVGFEVFLDAGAGGKKKGTSRGALTLSPLMPVHRDFAFLVSNDVTADAVCKTVRLVDRALITDAHVFDVYAGKGVADGHKSLALSVTLTPSEKTLTDAEIEALCGKIVEAVKAKTGGVLRT
jgi:phenylalanyl-tRNA synthetase beta chain